MHVNNLPEVKLLGRGREEETIALALHQVASAGSFQHVTIIEGAPRSGRIFSSWPLEDTVPLPWPLTAFPAARELVKLTPEARYEEKREPFAVKGWEIGMTILGDFPVAVAWAAWV